MIESFVDLTYRGLALGRRIKLTQVRPTTGYLELPTPMPVGTQVSIATDEGVVLDAIVTRIHEQVGGSDRQPGMTVSPTLAADDADSSPAGQAARWWKARVALPELAEEAPAVVVPRSRPVTVRPRTHTIPQPMPSAAAAPPVVTSTEVTATKEMSVYVAPATEPSAPPPGEEGTKTSIMNAVDQELLAQLTSSDGVVESLVRRTGEHDVVDDGQRTTVMDAVDPAALGLETSGSMPAVTDEEAEDDQRGAPADEDKKAKPAGNGGGKKRKKRR